MYVYIYATHLPTTAAAKFSVNLNLSKPCNLSVVEIKSKVLPLKHIGV
jgi:hypothetical protein